MHKIWQIKVETFSN